MLALKFSEAVTHQHRGHFIVEEGQSRIWLTAQDGAEVSGTSLNAARAGGRSVAGLRATDEKAANRDIKGRELAEQKGCEQTKDNQPARQEKAALLATGNQLAKFAADGVTLIDSAVTETGGNVGIGTTTPGSILEMVRPGATDVVFRMANATRAWSVGVSGAGDFWRIRDNTSGAARLAILGINGNVGIGTTNPGSPLTVVSNGSTAIFSTSVSAHGVYGRSGSGSGVQGDSFSNVGVYGQSENSTGVVAQSANQIGIYARGPVHAGYFDGTVHVTGNLSKGGGSFKIDHPLDPENKYLYHSFVESPDMMNIYNGVATLGEFGAAEITLPDWFESLNSDYRYQLTAIGMPGPNLFVRTHAVIERGGSIGGVGVGKEAVGGGHRGGEIAHLVQP